MAGQIEGQLFRADNNETQAAELFRLGLTQIQPQECGRREQERKAVLFDQRCALRGVQWIRKRDDAHTLDERIPQCDRRSKRMEERQRAEDGIGFSCVEQLAELRDVSDHIAVTYYNAFRISGRSACKKQDRFGVPALFGNLQKPQKQPCRNQQRYYPPENDLAFHRREQLVQLQNLFRPWKIFESLHERCR